MSLIKDMSKDELLALKKELEQKFENFKAENHQLNMSRGKPSPEQLDITEKKLNGLKGFIAEDDIDVRNYGGLSGLKQCREMLSDLTGIPADNIVMGGTSSLNLIYDAVAREFMFGSDNCKPWHKLDKVKFLCPVPGYDRHFAILEEFGIEMINIEMDENGPDMDTVEKLAAEDESIKGIMCVPLYANPNGVCYSSKTVERLAKMKTAAGDFKIFWDNAYGIHHIYKETKLANIFELCRKYGNEDRLLYFFSFSKITYPGSSISMVAGSDNPVKEIIRRMSVQTIGHDKVNQLRHVALFKNAEGVREHMAELAEIIRPKFDIVLDTLERELKDTGLLTWSKPNGGYFVSADTMEGCAKETVRLTKEAGVVMTGAGATYPYKNDPKDTNIRIAPTYPSEEELQAAMDIFCVCVKLAGVNKLLGGKE
ncbi:MAG: aminotransferase [Firmicutes bacterium]|nr:aminotransferase [Bacillota bacterium]